MQKQINN